MTERRRNIQLSDNQLKDTKHEGSICDKKYYNIHIYWHGECHYAVSSYTDCRVFFIVTQSVVILIDVMLSVVLLRVVMLSVFMLSVVMLSVAMLRDVMLSVEFYLLLC
jgi:hypothetical protein